MQQYVFQLLMHYVCHLVIVSSSALCRYCYNGVLEACRLAEPPQWQHACSLLAQMKQEGTAPNEVCYKTAINACRAASEDDVAESLLSDMIAAGFATQAEELKTPPVAAAAECASP